jgi:putative two-component system response regulator
MISAENNISVIERAYELGVTDFISRPFDEPIVRRRVVNTIFVYAKQRKLIGMVAEQMYEKEKSSALMIAILSHIVEFRNNESGLHVLHINTITEILLNKLVQKTDKYKLSRADINLIKMASSLHDIGKIGIPTEILNKPGKFTPEEFAVMKTHSMLGAQMLDDLPFHKDEPLVKLSYQICRWHHERYDGKGYPDGLKGEEIPISAQIVSIADVYDALTSERVYKKAFSHEVAMNMIMNGECGTFNPLLLECLVESAEMIQKEMSVNSINNTGHREMRTVAEDMLNNEEMSLSERALHQLEYERIKNDFYASVSDNIYFEYTSKPQLFCLSPQGVRILGLDETTTEPYENPKFLDVMGKENLSFLHDQLRKTSVENPIIQHDCMLKTKSGYRWFRIICRAIRNSAKGNEYAGSIGKAIDIEDDRKQLTDLKRLSSHDSLTGLLNQRAARELAERKLSLGGRYIMFLIDIDDFSNINYKLGYIFGNSVLVHVSDILTSNLRSNDIISRSNGDMFMLFLDYKDGMEPLFERIFASLDCDYKGLHLTVSMGITKSCGSNENFDEIYKKATDALLEAKKRGKHSYYIYHKEEGVS